MYSRAKLSGHPIHVMLVAFPIVFYTAATVGYSVFQFGNHDAFWFKLAYYMNVAGVATALLAAVPGMIDLTNVPRGNAARKRGGLHAGLNVTALIFFAIVAIKYNGMANNPPADAMLAVALTILGSFLTMAAGFHGWELIARHKLGVDLTPEQERIEPVGSMEPRGTEKDLTGFTSPTHI